VQLKINLIEDCIFKQEHNIQFLVYLEFELVLIEFDIQIKFSQENSQLFSFINKDIKHQYLKCFH